MPKRLMQKIMTKFSIHSYNPSLLQCFPEFCLIWLGNNYTPFKFMYSLHSLANLQGQQMDTNDINIENS